MARTCTGDKLEVLGNVAKSYTTLDDAAPTLIDSVKASKDTLMGSAVAVRSCINDLLILYQSFLKAYLDQSKSASTSTAVTPFKQMTKIMSEHIPLPEEDFQESSYGLG